MDYLSTGNVAYPKLTLYAFHLKHSLAQKPKDPVKNADHLWLKCQQLSKQFGVPELETLPELIETANSQKTNITREILKDFLTFTPIQDQQNLQLTCDANPLEIHDTYALDLTFRYPNPDVKLADLTGLNPENCLLSENINASLGQTLVFFAQPVGKIDDKQAFADACVKGLLSKEEVQKLNIYCQHSGKLLGSPIFEYNNNSNSPEKQCHILIWLNTHPETTTLEEKGEYYYPLIDLLLCHSKIIYARSEAIWCYEQARKTYSDLEKYKLLFIEQKDKPLDSEKLNIFNQWLHEIPKIHFNYVDYLRDLELQKTTIQTNSKNYRLYLDKLKKISLTLNELEFFSNFLKLAEDTYVEQINTNLAYLTPAQNLFDQMTGTIRGIVEVEQANRDRGLQLRIALVGTGLAVSGISSQTPAKPVETILTQLDLKQSLDCPNADLVPCLGYSAFYVLFHVGIGVIAALILYLIISLVSKTSRGNK